MFDVCVTGTHFDRIVSERAPVLRGVGCGLLPIRT